MDLLSPYLFILATYVVSLYIKQNVIFIHYNVNIKILNKMKLFFKSNLTVVVKTLDTEPVD